MNHPSDIVEIDGCCAGVPARVADILDTQHITFGPVHIGDRAIIGAGAVVLQDVPPDSVAVGNPARTVTIGESPNLEVHP